VQIKDSKLLQSTPEWHTQHKNQSLLNVLRCKEVV